MAESTLTCNSSPLQPTGFKIILDRKYYPNVAFFANTVNHPSMDLEVANQFTPRLAAGIPQAGDALTFGELSVTMILDEDLMAYTEIYNWMIRLVNEPRVGHAEGGVPTECDIVLEILTSNNNLNRSIRYLDCVPTSLGQIPLTTNVSDVEPLYVDVGFRYSYFTIGDKQ
jgi:hypothetical protein